MALDGYFFYGHTVQNQIYSDFLKFLKNLLYPCFSEKRPNLWPRKILFTLLIKF